MRPSGKKQFEHGPFYAEAAVLAVLVGGVLCGQQFDCVVGTEADIIARADGAAEFTGVAVMAGGLGAAGSGSMRGSRPARATRLPRAVRATRRCAAGFNSLASKQP
jgi:hypothetical protein